MNIYNELDTALAAVLQTTSAKTVQPYNEQYKSTDTDHARSYPATYYELLDPISFSQAGNQYQQARVRMRMHCVVYDITEGKSKVTTFAQEVFLKLHQIKLYDADQRELTSELVRIGSDLPKRYKNLKVIIIDFECEAFDYSTLPTNLSGPITFNVLIPQI